MKKIEKYKGKTVLLKPKQENELHEMNCNKIIENNKEQFEKLGFENNKENKMVDMFLTKKIVDNLHEYESKEKINLIFQNEKYSFDYMFEKTQEAIHAIKKFWHAQNKKPKEGSFLTEYEFPKEYIDFLKTQYSYQKEIQKRRFLNVTGKNDKTENELQLEACETVYEEVHKKHRTVDNLMNVMNINFIRVEFDFKEGKMNIYNCFTKLSAIRNRQFRPWDAIYTSEVLINSYPKSEWKKLLFNNGSLLEESISLEGIEMKEQECAIHQNTNVYVKFFENLKLKEVLSTMALLISEEMIKEEKTIIMVPKRNKTTKKVKITETVEKNELIQLIDEEKLEEMKKKTLIEATSYKIKNKRPNNNEPALLKEA